MTGELGLVTGEPDIAQEQRERLNMTVTCAEPSSPCRVAARGETWRPTL